MLLESGQGLYRSLGLDIGNRKVASFDLDWTLVRPVHNRFFRDENDWAYLPNRISKLKEYVQNGYTLAIFTNQGYQGGKLKTAIARVNSIISDLNDQGLKPFVFAATGPNNKYRKPSPLMWTEFSKHVTNIDKSQSFYVGDAAGRIQDHDNVDKEFSQNIDLTFFTPEEIFPLNVINIPTTQTMFIFVGMQGAGKSTYSQKLEDRGWTVINLDKIANFTKSLEMIRSQLAAGKSVVVDATNYDVNKRLKYLTMAVEYQVPTMILYFIANGYGWNKLRQNPIPDVAYNVYYKNLTEPSYEVDHVPVVEIE